MEPRAGVRMVALLLLLSLSSAQDGESPGAQHNAKVGSTINGIPVVGEDFDVDAYVESFENGNGQSPELVQASELLKQAREKEKEGDLGGAEEDLNDAIDTLKSTPGAKRLLSAGFFARGRHWVKRGNDLKATRDFGRAIKHLDDGNVMDKALVLYERGLCFHRRKKLIAAEDDLTDAIDHIVAEIEVTPDDNVEQKNRLTMTQAGWFTMKGLVHADMGNHTVAMALHHRAIKINPNVTAAWANRAAEYEYAEVWDKAISDYDQRIALQPETAANAHLHRGFCKLQQDKSIAGRESAIADMTLACEAGLDVACKNAQALQQALEKQRGKAAAAAAASNVQAAAGNPAVAAAIANAAAAAAAMDEDKDL